jgi:hypothetical protein
VFVARLPALVGDLRSWLTTARSVLHDIVTALVGGPAAHAGGRAVITNEAWAQRQAADVFAAAPPDLAARTVHGFKGEDSEAVMVCCAAHDCQRSDRSDGTLGGGRSGTEIDADKAEERRVIFVALTRAQRYCLVALPDDKRGKDVAAKCATLGFRVLAD